jgi:PII-like signaling protein
MKFDSSQISLRVYLRNTDRKSWRMETAAEAIVTRARREGLAGATLLRGFFGLDINGELLERSFWSFVDHVPVIVELVDSAEAIARFLPDVCDIVEDGIATLRGVRAWLYRRIGLSESGHPQSLQLVHPPEKSTVLTTSPTSRLFQQGEDADLLRVFLGESDLWQGTALYRAIVHEARELGLGPVAVFRAPLGIGADGSLRAAKLFLPFLDSALAQGFLTIEKVRLIRFQKDDPAMCQMLLDFESYGDKASSL